MAGRRIFCSFSGGESSAEMTLRVKRALRPNDELLVMFANTGQEDERTLVFVDRCDREFDLNVVWVEAVINPEHRQVTTHRVVTFETATRDKSLFEAMIRKYGIPNQNYPHCTRELKLRPMASYLASMGWTAGSYITAIGIRADEIDRIDGEARAKGFEYPLARAGIRKRDVHAAWDARPFQLGLREHEGNCRWCWKKSPRKHLTLITEQPSVYDVPRYFERTYPHAGAGDGPRVFFRGGRSTDDLFALAAQPFEPFVDMRGKGQMEFGFAAPAFDADLDLGGSCGESCEPYGDERSPTLEAAE
ncbi:hypothetical protein [Methylorubrum extorquens]|uniref:Phosphoadenosine phosphosulfate reductase n=1 Tax=Methylorubrum extorquens DSM 13060 TaxID=882800 RepID=H1KCB7_METEX|nr:hypothetical protein [Methylorubrum extorquens]EHP94934.1 hypothetical protein MetexDRAFT_0279 [Methylorubrum extorquens DSM 13060]